MTVYCEGEEVNGCPVRIRAVPNAPLYTGNGMAPCAVGSLVEVLVSVTQLSILFVSYRHSSLMLNADKFERDWRR